MDKRETIFFTWCTLSSKKHISPGFQYMNFPFCVRPILMSSFSFLEICINLLVTRYCNTIVSEKVSKYLDKENKLMKLFSSQKNVTHLKILHILIAEKNRIFLQPVTKFYKEKTLFLISKGCLAFYKKRGFHFFFQCRSCFYLRNIKKTMYTEQCKKPHRFFKYIKMHIISTLILNKI